MGETMRQAKRRQAGHAHRVDRRGFLVAAAAALSACAERRPILPATPRDAAFYGPALPPDWLPAVARGGVKRIIAHWTGGTYVVSPEDLEHYHFIIERDGAVRRGRYSVTANARRVNRSKPYARHTRRLNSHSVGVAVAGMGGAKRAPFDTGDYPILERQWRRLAGVCADVVNAYGLKIDQQSVLTHAEVGPVLDVSQGDKWDITRLPFAPSLIGFREVGARMRADIETARTERLSDAVS